MAGIKRVVKDQIGNYNDVEINKDEVLRKLWDSTYAVNYEMLKFNEHVEDDSHPDEQKLAEWLVIQQMNAATVEYNKMYISRCVEEKSMSFNEATSMVVEVMFDAATKANRDYMKKHEK